MTRALLLILVACAKEPAPPPAAAPPPKYPALAGSWSGGAEETPYGPARATLFVGAEGWGSLTVMAKGHVLSRRFQILEWDGRIARIDSDGPWDVAVAVAGGELRIDVPGVGVVPLRRTDPVTAR